MFEVLFFVENGRTKENPRDMDLVSDGTSLLKCFPLLTSSLSTIGNNDNKNNDSTGQQFWDRPSQYTLPTFLTFQPLIEQELLVHFRISTFFSDIGVLTTDSKFFSTRLGCPLQKRGRGRKGTIRRGVEN